MRKRIVSAVVFGLIFAAGADAAVITHQFDFGPFGQAVEAGWTNINTFTFFDNATSTAGTGSFGSKQVFTVGGTPTYTPINLMKDYFYTYSDFNPATDDRLIFRDYVPAGSVSVQITVYRSSEGSAYLSNRPMEYSINGADDPRNNATWTTFDSGDGLTADAHAPVTGTFSVSSASRFDINFSDVPFSGNMRVNGVSLVYSTPEPASLALLVVGGLLIARQHSRR
jgi:hypothetical protein